MEEHGRRHPLAGTVQVVLGATGGIGLELCRQLRTQGAEVVLAARSPDRLVTPHRTIAICRLTTSGGRGHHMGHEPGTPPPRTVGR
jgi:NAD(P)-dependent dehydrogenase (short-subunit alcohol dehydrogenase family)